MGVAMTIHNWTHFGQPDPMGVGAHCLQKITSHSIALTVLSLRTSGQPDPFRNQTMPRGSKTLVCVLKLFPHGLNVRRCFFSDRLAKRFKAVSELLVRRLGWRYWLDLPFREPCRSLLRR